MLLETYAMAWGIRGGGNYFLVGGTNEGKVTTVVGLVSEIASVKHAEKLHEKHQSIL